MGTKHGLPVTDRFEAKFERGGPGDCWLWTAGKTYNGYGMFGTAECITTAHRWSYMLYVGPIPDGLVVDHLCRVRNCVNPDHLEPVTHAENARRRGARMRADKAARLAAVAS
jgi:hypothetical protein